MGLSKQLYDLYFLNDKIMTNITLLQISAIIGARVRHATKNTGRTTDAIHQVFRICRPGEAMRPMYIESCKSKVGGLGYNPKQYDFNFAVVLDEHGVVVDYCNLKDIIEMLELELY